MHPQSQINLLLPFWFQGDRQLIRWNQDKVCLGLSHNGNGVFYIIQTQVYQIKERENIQVRRIIWITMALLTFLSLCKTLQNAFLCLNVWKRIWVVSYLFCSPRTKNLLKLGQGEWWKQGRDSRGGSNSPRNIWSLELFCHWHKE